MPYAPPVHGAGRTKENRQAYDRQRDDFTSNRQWRALRRIKLDKNPLCEECLRSKIIKPATQVDHIKPRDEHPELTWDETNLQSLCDPCHGRKTRAEHKKKPQN